jgi:hypothetical protein
MEKIRLASGTEFGLVPMGIVDKDKLRYFKFVSSLSYDEIKAIFSESNNVSSIDYVLSDGSTYLTYADGVAYKCLSFVPDVAIDDNTVSDVYIVTISTDPTGKAIQTLNAEMDNITNTIVMMTMF